jgi:hypothetical protein
MSEYNMPRRILERKQPEVTEHWNNYITSSFTVCTLHQKIQEVKTGRTPGTHIRDKCMSENLKGKTVWENKVYRKE